MNWVDFTRGTGTILMIMVIAGAIAYVGDRVGHQVGRKRLTLFNIRPRYTSTIVAIATGMVIAFVVTIGAILASQQVKTAFFKLNSLNEQITDLQGRQRELEAKVTTGQLALPIDSLMVPFYSIVPQGANDAQRLAKVISYYSNAVQYINATYPRLGLKPYKAPPDLDKTLAKAAQELQAPLSQGDVLLTISSDQNLFVNDPIHFELNATVDARRFVKGQPIATLEIPGGRNASVNLALSQLQTYVKQQALDSHMPRPLASNVQALQILPDPRQMQQMISKPGTYYLTAYAADDVFPHTGGVPIVIALSTRNAR
jgi:hypothetical protein